MIRLSYPAGSDACTDGVMNKIRREQLTGRGRCHAIHRGIVENEPFTGERHSEYAPDSFPCGRTESIRR